MDTKETNTGSAIADELVAAEAELRTAQAKLDEARAKVAQKKQETTSEPPISDAPKTYVADVVASGPIELDAKPISSSTTAVGDPDWTPYTTADPAPQPPIQNNAQEPVPQQPNNPNTQNQEAYYWQQPQQNVYTQPNQQYAPPQNPYTTQQQPYYQQPYAPVVSSKDHVAAGLLAIFLGTLGIHKFYLGYNSTGFIMLAVTILGSIITFGLAAAVMAVISFIEGILYLVKSQSEFEQTYVLNKREWF